MNIKTEDQIVSAVGAEVIKQELSFYMRGLLRGAEGSIFMRYLAESLSAEMVNSLVEGIALRVPKSAKDGALATKYNLNSGDPQTTQDGLRQMLIDTLTSEIAGYTGPGGDGRPSDYTQP